MVRLSNLPPGVTDRMVEEQAGAFEDEPQAIARRQPGAITAPMLNSYADIRAFAEDVVAGGLAPKGAKAGGVVVVLQAGRELGITPVRALSCLTAINGRVGIMGDAAKALIYRAGVLVPGSRIESGMRGTKEEALAYVRSHRVGWTAPVESTFSVKEARRAGLWGKAGPWREYPQRMLYYRALGFHTRDHYPDVMLGFAVSEELRDYPTSEGLATDPPQGEDPLFQKVESTTLDEPNELPDEGPQPFEGRPGDTCPHGAHPSECDACFRQSDEAYDASREGR